MFSIWSLALPTLRLDRMCGGKFVAHSRYYMGLHGRLACHVIVRTNYGIAEDIVEKDYVPIENVATSTCC